MRWGWLRALVLASTISGIAASAANAQSFPDHTVRLVIPFPAGGATDIIARVVSQSLSAKWKEPVIADNVAGATGTIGAMQIARATPDGYNLLIGTASVNSVLPSVRPDLAYDTLRDYAAVSMLATFPNVLVVKADFPAKSVADLIAMLKANPGKYTFGSSGFGGSIHLAGELFKLRTGTQMTHVAYRGSAPALAELLAGHVDMMFDNLADVTGYIKNGDLRALGVAMPTRSAFLPDVPAIAETLPGFEATSWVGLLAPIATPKPVIDKIAKDTNDALATPEVTQPLKNIGSDPGAMSTVEFADYIRKDVEKWRKVVKDANLKVE